MKGVVVVLAAHDGTGERVARRRAQQLLDRSSIVGWRGDERVYQETVTLSALGPSYFQADFSAVTRIEFRTAHYWQAIFDDLEFRVPAD